MVAAALAAVSTVSAPTVAPSVPKSVRLIEIWSSAAIAPAPTWKVRVLAAPVSSLMPLKFVLAATRVSSLARSLISVLIAPRDSVLFESLPA